MALTAHFMISRGYKDPPLSHVAELLRAPLEGVGEYVDGAQLAAFAASVLARMLQAQEGAL